MPSVEDDLGDDPAVRFKMRFSVRRFEASMKCLTPKQVGFVVKYGYEPILELKHKAVFPMVIIDWVMDKMVPELAMFRHEHKRINFDKNMMQQFVGIPAGGTIAKLSSKDSVIVDKVNLLKAKYMGTGNKIFMRTLIDQLKGDEDEESFMRTFMMVLLGTILCPSTSDTVDWKFLYSLTDLATMTSVDWAALSLQVLLNEVANFKKKLLNFPNGIPSTAIYVGGCLPFLAVVYMDFLELNACSIQHNIDYGVPRLFHVDNADFKLLIQFDRIKCSGRVCFGAIDFREKSCTPYGNLQFEEFLVSQSKRQQLVLASLGYTETENMNSDVPSSNVPSSSQDNMNSDPFNVYSNNRGDIPLHLQKIVGSIIKSNKEKIAADVTKLLETSFHLMSAEIFSAISEHCQPPQVETPLKSPADDTHFKAQSTDTHSQPPTSETHFQPPTGSASNIVSSPRQEYDASDHVHFMDKVEVAVVKSSNCNDIVSEQDKVPADSNVTGDKMNCDAGTSSPQADPQCDTAVNGNESVLDKDKDDDAGTSSPQADPQCDIAINDNEAVLDKDKDDDAISYNEPSDVVADAQADPPSVLDMKTHNEPVLDEVDTRDAETVHSLDPKQPPCPTIPSVADTLLDAGTASILQEDFQSDVVHSVDPEKSPPANLVMPNQDAVVIVSSAANFSHPQYDESGTSRESLMKAKTLLDDATASPKHLHLNEDSGASVVYISSQEMEVNHFVENVIIGDVTSAPLSSSLNAESHSDTIKSAAKDCDESDVNLGIDIAMSYASEDPKSPLSNDHTPLCTSSDEVKSDDVLKTGPSTIDKRKRKKRYAKRPCNSEERLNLIVDHSAETFYNKNVGKMLFKNSKKFRETSIVVDIDGHTVTYERFYQSLKPRGEIANEVMDAFVQLFNNRNVKVKDDKSSLRKISFSPFFASKLNVPPEKFDAKSVTRELGKMNKKFNLAKCDLLHFPVVSDNHWTITSINLLFKKINFLDSLQDTDKEKKAIMASNIVTNFHKACTVSKCFSFTLDNYVPEIPLNLPQQTTTYDCGVFSFLYMEHWEGQEFKMFESALISNVRKVVAHALVSSEMNDMTTELESFKKQRLS